MSDLLVVAILVSLILVGLLFLLLSKRAGKVSASGALVSQDRLTSEHPEISELALADLPLSFKNLATIPDRSELVEVKDLELISRLDAVIPNAMNAVTQFTNRIPKNAVLIDIPYKDLVDSKAVNGMKRAFKMGKDGIAKNANVSELNLAKSAQLANITAGVVNVAALLVGQQLMAEINSKLSELTHGIDHLQEIAIAELKSKLLADLAMVMEISNAQVEILGNPELRQNKLNSIDEHKKSVVQLLGQVNLMIEDVISKPDYRLGSKGFKEYETAVKGLGELMSWQKTLIALLEQISNLSHALSLGVISREKSNATFLQYLDISEKINQRLGAWHEKQIKALQIDLLDGRAAKGIIERLPGLVKEDWKYLQVEKGLSNSIESQKSSHLAPSSTHVESFKADVQLVLENGRYYYRPNM